MLIAKRVEMIIIRGKFIGIWISGFDLLRFEDFAFRAIRRIRAPVIPLEIAPPIPRIRVKPVIWKYSARM